MSKGIILLEQKGPVAVLTLNRPDRHNAFNREMWEAFEDTVTKLSKKLPRAVIITGAGDRAFSAGFDVNPDNPQVAALIEAVKEHRKEPVMELVNYIRGVTDSFTSLPVPVIAAINGLAYGGGAELATRCDLRIMDPAAVISFSEVRLGLMPDWGGGVALSRLLGRAKAADLVLTGRKVTADEALALGFAGRVSAPGRALEEALDLAGIIAANGPLAVRAALKVIRSSGDMALDEALIFETDVASGLIASGECMHGITAFLSKKVPDFPDPD